MEKHSHIRVFVDESGQDDLSPFFVVVAVLITKDPEGIRTKLIDIEQTAKTGRKKWHKLRQERRMHYLSVIALLYRLWNF